MAAAGRAVPADLAVGKAAPRVVFQVVPVVLAAGKVAAARQ
jgi:hypothetical protein